MFELIEGLTVLKWPEDQVHKLDEWVAYFKRRQWVKYPGLGQRRVQQYGAVYDYEKKKCIHRGMPFSETLTSIMDGLCEATGLERSDIGSQCIVNRYLSSPPEGIGPHADAACFGEHIACLTLCGTANMVFSHPNTHQSVTVFTQSGTVVWMQGPARHVWRHRIDAVCKDVVPGGGGVVTRVGERISVTFRKLLI